MDRHMITTLAQRLKGIIGRGTTAVNALQARGGRLGNSDQHFAAKIGASV
jgi:hypothetical protein